MKQRYREWRWFIAFTLPGLLLFATFTWWPILYTVRLSLTDWVLPSATYNSIGFANFVSLFQDEIFWAVLRNTALYAVAVVVIAQTLAFALALLLNQPIRGRMLFRTLAFTPHVTTTAAAALVWVALLDPAVGPFSRVFEAIGADAHGLLADSALALWGAILVGIWQETGFATVFFLSGLQGLPRESYESARIDGASRFLILRHITLPLMTPVIFFLIVSGSIAAIKVFDIVALMTEGGPVYPASSTYVYHLYKLGFRDYRFGYASAFAVVFFFLTLLLTIAQFRIARRWVHDGE